MYARSMVLPLQEGQTVTLVVGGCYDARSCRVGVRADRIVPSGYAPELSRAAVYRWSPRSFAVVEARDADANAELMVVELRAADGSLVPFGDLPRREVPLGGDADPRPEYQLDLGEIPARAVRARIWAEDAAGLRSAVHDVVIKPRPVLALGERCEDRALESCAPDALCTYSAPLLDGDLVGPASWPTTTRGAPRFASTSTPQSSPCPRRRSPFSTRRARSSRGSSASTGSTARRRTRSSERRSSRATSGPRREASHACASR